MTDGQRLVLVLAQMIELVRSKPDGIDEAKEVLRSLAEMTTRQSWTVRLRGPDLVIEGVAVLADTSPVPLLVTQMSAHEVGEIHFAQGVSAVDGNGREPTRFRDPCLSGHYHGGRDAWRIKASARTGWRSSHNDVARL